MAPDDEAEWHRRFAADLYNRAWDLFENPSRSPADDEDMLAAAFASRYHWGIVGGPEQRALGDEHIARVCAAIGLGDLAVRYAASGLEITEHEGWTDYRRAAAFETMARAHAAAQHDAEREAWLARAKEAVGELEDADERAVIEAQLRTVPGYRD